MPGCSTPVYNENDILLGEFAHIYPVGNGARFDAAINEDFINTFDNLMILCPTHHTEVDKDPNRYSAVELQQIKKAHEAGCSETIVSDALLDRAYQSCVAEILKELQEIHHKIDQLLHIARANYFRPAESLYDFSEQQNQVKMLRSSGRHLAVLELLRDHKQRHWHEMSEENKYKWTLNLGITYLDLNDFVTAAPLLTGLTQYSYKNEAANGFTALGYLIEGKLEIAELYANMAIQETPNDPNAYIVLLKIRNTAVGSYEIKLVDIPQQLQANPAIRVALANIYEDHNRFDEAREIFQSIERESIEDIGFLNDLKIYLGIALVRSVPHPEIVFKGHKKATVPSAIYEALTLLNEAADYYKLTDLLKSRYYIFVNRGVIYKLLGKAEQAEDDFKRAIELNPSYITYRYLMMNRPDREWGTILVECKKLPLNELEQLEIAQIEAEQLLPADPMEALVKLEEVKEIAAKLVGKFEFYYLLLGDIYFALDRLAEIPELIKFLKSSDQLQLVYYYLLTRYSIATGNDDEYKRFSSMLACKADETNTVWARSMVFDLLCKVNDFQAAEKVLRPICDRQNYTEYSKKFLQSLYNCGFYAEAAEWINAYIDLGQEDEFLVDMLSSIYEHSDNLDQAIKLVEAYLKKSASVILEIKLALLYFSQNEIELCQKTLHQIEDVSRLNLAVKFKVAIMLIRCGFGRKGLELLYIIRGENARLLEAHADYINIIAQYCLSLDDYRKPRKIGLNSAVLLTGREQNREVVVSNTARFDYELPIEDPLASELLGLSEGSTLRIQGEEYRVTELRSKYAFALNKSLECSMGRQDKTGIEIEKADPASTDAERQNAFKESIQTRSKEEQQFVLAGQMKYTFEVMARGIGENCIHFWERHLAMGSLVLVAVNGTAEGESVFPKITSNHGIIFDLFSLLVLFYTDNWGFISKLANKKYVTSSALRQLDEEIASVQQHRSYGTFYSVWPKDNGLQRMTITSEDLERRIAQLTDLKKRILEGFTIMAGDLPINAIQKAQQDQRLGHCSSDLLIAAQKLDLLIVSEDVYLRYIVANEFALAKSSVGNIAFYLQQTGKIPRETFDSFAIKLLKINYQNLPVDHEIMYRAFEEDGYRIGRLCKLSMGFFMKQHSRSKVPFMLFFCRKLFTKPKLSSRAKKEALGAVVQLYFDGAADYSAKTLLLNNLEQLLDFPEKYKVQVSGTIESVYQAIGNAG
jgi:tetratricopeptide (TPR) repeat protein